MLVLTRKKGERIKVGDVTFIIRKIGNKTVAVGIEAPKDVPIVREELLNRPEIRRAI